MKPIQILKTEDNQVVKASLELNDGQIIETVLMKYREWYSACLSVMVGCPLGCKFCATGKMGFVRNLSAEEIAQQLDFWGDYLKNHSNQKRVSRVVFMGMGEPFLNWENVWQSIKIFNSPGKYNIAQNHISISTAGIIKGIYEFTDLKTKINLAVSLHSPFQDQREEIMPIVAKNNPLSELMKASGHYVKTIGKKIFFEYALIYKFNDNLEDIKELKKILGSKLFHLNIIVLNPTDSPFKPSGMGRRIFFIKALKKEKIPFTVRRSLGKEINAACGQLATKTKQMFHPQEQNLNSPPDQET